MSINQSVSPETAYLAELSFSRFDPDIKNIGTYPSKIHAIIKTLAIVALAGLVAVLTGIFLSSSLIITGAFLICPIAAAGVTLLISKKWRTLFSDTKRDALIQSLSTQQLTEIAKNYSPFYVIKFGLLAKVGINAKAISLTRTFAGYYEALQTLEKSRQSAITTIQETFKKRFSLQAEIPYRDRSIEWVNKNCAEYHTGFNAQFEKERKEAYENSQWQ